MPFKKYREHLIYKRFEKKVATPPPSASTSLQSVPLSTAESLATSNSSNADPESTRSSPGRSISRPVYLDDEYNPYRYGLVPLSERSIYREFQVIQPPKNMVWKEAADVKASNGARQKSTCAPNTSMLSSNTKSLDREKKTVRIVEDKHQEKVNGSGKKMTSSRAGNQEIIIPIRKEFGLAAEPVPQPIRSYKCTSYTLNEIRSC